MIKNAHSEYSLPLPVNRALRKLGGDIRDARRRRRLPMALVAERASTTRKTVMRIEQGDPGVSTGLLASVLFVLGLADRLGELADVRHDAQGLALEEERLPKRVRPKKQRASKPAAPRPPAEKP